MAVLSLLSSSVFGLECLLLGSVTYPSFSEFYPAVLSLLSISVFRLDC